MENAYVMYRRTLNLVVFVRTRAGRFEVKCVPPFLHLGRVGDPRSAESL